MTRPFVVFNAASRDRRELVGDRADGEPSSCRSTCPRAATPTIDLDAARRRRRRAVTVADRVARERAAARHVGRRRAAHVGVRQGARPRGARARRARQPVPAARRQPAATSTRGTSTSTTSTQRVDLTERLVDRDRRARPAARRGALRARVRRVDDHADDAARERIAPARLRHRGRLARAPQVPEGRVPGRRAREPRDLRDPVRPPRTADAREHVVGRRALRGVRAPVGRPRASRATASRSSTTASTATTSTAT